MQAYLNSVFYIHEKLDPESDSLIFLNHNKQCRTDTDCGTLFLHCLPSYGQFKCKHKSVFPIHSVELEGTVILTILMTLAVISGIGGGGIIVSLLMTFYKLNTHEAIAVSGFTIFMGSLARFFMVVNKRHPEKDATVVDYSLANIMLPCVLVGSLFGVFLNLILPALILQICLSCVLILLALMSGFKAVEIYRQESGHHEDPEQPPQQPSIREQEINFLKEMMKESEAKNLEILNDTDAKLTTKQREDRTEFHEMVQLEKTHWQWEKQMINVSIFIGLAVLNIYRGSKVNPSVFGIKMCSGLDWLGIFVFVSLCFSLTFYSIKSQMREQQLKLKYSNLIKSEIELTSDKIFKLILISLMGGWVSGALGMGGGSVFNPLLLSLGVPPQVSSATGMYMMIFSTGASTLTYIHNDLLNFSYGIWAGFFCIMGTMLGMALMDKLMRRVRRQSP